MTQSPGASPALARNLLLEAELVELARLLRGAGVPFVVLKGLPLLRRLSRPLDARAVIDNDVLVRRADVARAVRAVESFGYEPLPYLSLQARLRSGYQFLHFREVQPGLRLPLELHWNSFDPLLYSVPESMLWRHTMSSTVRNEPIDVFDAPLTVVHLAAHYAADAFSQPRVLKELASAYDAWRPAQEALASIAQPFGLHHALEFALHAARDLGWLETAPPSFGSTRARRLRRWLPLEALQEPIERVSYSRRVAPLTFVPPRRAAVFLRHKIVPPLAEMAAKLEEPATPALFFRYPEYLSRPVRRWLGWR